MTTVDSLLKLYKKLCGKDYAYEVDPTDAEVIDKIAEDAETGEGSGVEAKIGDLDDLDTTDKTNLVAAINEVAESGGGSDPEIPIIDIVDDGVNALTTIQTYKEITDLIADGCMSFYVTYTSTSDEYKENRIYDFERIEQTDDSIHLISLYAEYDSSTNKCTCKAREVSLAKVSGSEPAIAAFTQHTVVV